MAEKRVSAEPKIFICYCREDVDTARELFRRLERSGAAPWLDVENLVRGDDWESEIKKAVAAADAFVVLLRPGFDERGFRQKEVKLAKEAAEERPLGKGFIIPFQLETCELPPWCDRLHAGEIGEPATFEELIRAINKHCGAAILGDAVSTGKGGRLGGRQDRTFTPLHELPPPPADFTGRDGELLELRKAAADGTRIIGIRGAGGIGKTALALKLAESLSGSYPDAQFYLDLRGAHEQKPLSVQEMMRHVIWGFRPADKLPDEEPELTAMYRTVLFGKSVLLLMDNARDEHQVQLLVPSEGSLLLVTSRKHFVLPGLKPLNLDILRLEDAVALLQSICPRLGEEAEELAEISGCYPLALRVSASALANREDLATRCYLDELRKTKAYLDDHAPDYERSATLSISLSYKQLEDNLKERWAMLACTAAATFDRAAAEALWDTDQRSASDTLGRLLRFSLVEWNPVTNRYHLHDLVRQVANERLDELNRA